MTGTPPRQGAAGAAGDSGAAGAAGAASGVPGTPGFSPRQRLLGLGLLLTLAACGYTAWQEHADAAAVPAPGARRPAGRTATAGLAPAPAPQGLGRVNLRTPLPLPGTAADQAWGDSPPAPVDAAPPAPAAPAVAEPPPPPPPAPQAPALAYRWIGRLDDAAGRSVMLASPQRALLVREGDVIDEQWRVQRIGADRVELLWLPGQLPRQLTLGS